ncbi:MAG: hypothetical protein ACE5HB_05860 [Terriglobia bacterium]
MPASLSLVILLGFQLTAIILVLYWLGQLHYLRAPVLHLLALTGRIYHSASRVGQMGRVAVRYVPRLLLL